MSAAANRDQVDEVGSGGAVGLAHLETGVLGELWGVDVGDRLAPVRESFVAFEAGARKVNPKVRVLTAYIGNWEDVSAGKGELHHVGDRVAGFVLGFGFAPFTGGALSYIDGMGAAKFVAMAKGLQKKYGAQFKAPKLLLEMAEKNELFYGRFNPKGGEKKAA